MAPTGVNLPAMNRSEVTESRDVDSHVSGTPQAGSCNQATLQQRHSVVQS